MSRLLECAGCATRYDVSGRRAGSRVRCRRCQAVLSVPDLEADPILAGAPGKGGSGVGGSASSSARLRARKRARTKPPQPAKPALDLLALDFGALATPLQALKALGPVLLRSLGWAVVALLTSLTVFLLPAFLGVLGFRAWGESVQGQLAALIALLSFGGFAVTYYLVLMPAGCILFVDDRLRGRHPPAREAFEHAARRVLQCLGALLQVCGFYLLLACLLGLPALVVAYWLALATGRPELPALLLFLWAVLSLVAVVSAFGLAVPVVVLEGRSAFEALGRSWELSAQRLPAIVAMLVGFSVFVGVCAAVAGAIGAAIGIPLLSWALGTIVDLMWPALLVTAYHGLAAEDAGLLGRRNR